MRLGRLRCARGASVARRASAAAAVARHPGRAPAWRRRWRAALVAERGGLEVAGRSIAARALAERVTPPAPRGAEARPGRRAREVLLRTPHCTIVARAAAFRKAPTLTEALLWQALRGSRLGTPFRRQAVLGRYIVDFLAPRAKLVVEVDGEVHAQRVAADARRDRDLARMGYRVLRLPRALVQQRVAEAVAQVAAALAEGG
ncbi:MAG: DUF559 domain-containing protein [Polyangiaceae bacterium]|nr:DUF559 domain-containing protein [Polyangiaceae bacterium]